MSAKVLIIQGPNLNLLGSRETGIYGKATLEELHDELKGRSEFKAVKLEFFQSNHEGELIDRIHQAAREDVSGIVINAAGLTHTSVALRDALLGVKIPYVEVHISNVHDREEFRHHSYLSGPAAGIVIGFGAVGYRLGLLGLLEKIREA